MFDFIVTEDQTRLAEVRQGQLLLAYGAIIEELLEETDDTTFITEETYAESDDILAASEQH